MSAPIQKVLYGEARRKSRFDAWAMLGLCLCILSAVVVVFCIKY